MIVGLIFYHDCVLGGPHTLLPSAPRTLLFELRARVGESAEKQLWCPRRSHLSPPLPGTAALHGHPTSPGTGQREGQQGQ